ncbi:hypothetical protein ANN_21152 [Periplaneta americana]|uniref:Reverse transcriptase domain-containing protein n=1 Tax=Periplaneta americana TaxID=6978 RepID=A0ABQ8SFD3_PERAM|nr:hypothetical protein ANN_21152 [Periplaneta americana]
MNKVMATGVAQSGVLPRTRVTECALVRVLMGKKFSHERSDSVWDRCPPSIVMHLGSYDSDKLSLLLVSFMLEVVRLSNADIRRTSSSDPKDCQNLDYTAPLTASLPAHTTSGLKPKRDMGGERVLCQGDVAKQRHYTYVIPAPSNGFSLERNYLLQHNCTEGYERILRKKNSVTDVFRRFRVLLLRDCFIASFLNRQKFQIKEGAALSSVHDVHAGLPQGSVIGPILYNIYTADMPTHPKTNIGQFADDTAVLITHQNPTNSHSTLGKLVSEMSPDLKFCPTDGMNGIREYESDKWANLLQSGQSPQHQTLCGTHLTGHGQRRTL